jgi:preprotein translocase subunit SecD
MLVSSCRKKNFDPTKITIRPRVFIEGAAPIPILDEYDVTGVQLGTFADVFSNDGEGRIFALWLSTDRRAAMTLQKETARHLGRRLSLVVDGEVIAVHPIEKTLTNGYIPFLFTYKFSEEQAMLIYNKFSESIDHLKAEFQDLKN